MLLVSIPLGLMPCGIIAHGINTPEINASGIKPASLLVPFIIVAICHVRIIRSVARVCRMRKTSLALGAFTPPDNRAG